jgi:hypothetical protein
VTTFDVVWKPEGSPSLAVIGGVRVDTVTVGPIDGKPYTTEEDIPRILAVKFSMNEKDVKIVLKSVRN